MIYDSDYINRKNKELELLGYLVKNNSDFNIIKYYENKLKNQVKLKKCFLNKIYNCQNTSRNYQKYKFDKFRFDYEYQRYDINIKHDILFNKLYGFSENYDYVFTNCGMSSLSGLFYALKNLNYGIEYIKNIYVETERLIDDYIFKDSNNINNKVLFLDSVSFKRLGELLKKYNLKKYEVFVFDTTLYVKNEIKIVINILKQYNKPIILVRSHTKMDMLGIEWSTLGSICITCDDKDFVSKLMKEIRIVLSFIGGFAYPFSIPLYWSNEEFYDVSLNRNKNIKKRTNLIYDALKTRFPNLNIIKPYHKMFILIKPTKYIDYKKLENDLHDYARKSKYKRNVYYADSFGMDFLGISGYYENMSADTELIRISSGDLPLDVLDEVLSSFCDWLENYLK